MVPVSLVRFKMVSLAGLLLPSQEYILALESKDMEKGDLVLYIGRIGTRSAATIDGFRKATKQNSSLFIQSLAESAILLPSSLVELQLPFGPRLASDPLFGLSIVVIPQKLH